MIVTAAVLGALIFFVLPQFSQVFVNLGRPAPPLTQALLTTAVVLRSCSGLIVALLVAATVAGAYASRTTAFQIWRDGFLLNAMLLKDAMRTLLAGRSFRLMGTLLESGVPLLDSIRLCQTAVKNYHFIELFKELETDVTHGRGLKPAVSGCSFLPSGAAQLVATAEQSGRLGRVLRAIGEHYEDEGEQLLRSAVRFLEPIVIVFVGIAVGGVVLCVMLPLLNVTGGG